MPREGGGFSIRQHQFDAQSRLAVPDAPNCPPSRRRQRNAWRQRRKDCNMPTIYKICTAAEWHAAEHAGAYGGSAVDRRAGFLHFSTAEQAAETAARHFAGQRDLVLIAVDAEKLGGRLKWEPS